MTVEAAPTPSPPVSTFTPLQINKWELGVSLLINNWRAMVDAVSCQWGGPNSADKRDWLCGAIADMFVERPETDAEDVEDVLVQVMADEFEVNLEDDSAYILARSIMILKEQVVAGDFEGVDEMERLWLEKGGRGNVSRPQVQEVDEEAGSSEDEEDVDDEEENTEMGEAPAPARASRSEPVIDEDGFETVQPRRRR